MRLRHGLNSALALSVLLAGATGAVGQYQMTILSGQWQTRQFLQFQHDVGQQGQAYAPLSVRVTDASGRPAAGVNVRFDCPANMGQQGVPMCTMVPSYNYSSNTVQANAEGVATLDRYHGASLILYYNTGTAIITATLPGLPGHASAQFSLTGTSSGAPTSGTLRILSGGTQRLERTTSGDGAPYGGGAGVSAPVVLQLVDTNGQGVRGITVCPEETASGPLQNSLGRGCMFTGPNGMLETGRIVFWNGTGSVRIQFNVYGPAFSAPSAYANFEIVEAHPVAQAGRAITILSGDGQHQPYLGNLPHLPFGGSMFDPLVVQVMDNGQPAPGVEVTFSCPTATPYACSLIPSYNYGNTTVTTNGQGIATLNKYSGKSVMLYYRPAANVPITASAGGAHVVFHITSGN